MLTDCSILEEIMNFSTFAAKANIKQTVKRKHVEATVTVANCRPMQDLCPTEKGI